jgi:hypothetical protein
VLFAVLLALGVTEKHDAAHDTRGRHPENGLGACLGNSKKRSGQGASSSIRWTV